MHLFNLCFQTYATFTHIFCCIAGLDKFFFIGFFYLQLVQRLVHCTQRQVYVFKYLCICLYALLTVLSYKTLAFHRFRRGNHPLRCICCLQVYSSHRCTATDYSWERKEKELCYKSKSDFCYYYILDTFSRENIKAC